MNSDVRVSNARSRRVGHGVMPAAQRDVLRAQDDYERLRAAYLAMAQTEHGHEVALAMIGADMDRAHATLQGLIGLCRLPVTHEPTEAWRREGRALAEEVS